jgi:hypothetical protein
MDFDGGPAAQGSRPYLQHGAVARPAAPRRSASTPHHLGYRTAAVRAKVGVAVPGSGRRLTRRCAWCQRVHDGERWIVEWRGAMRAGSEYPMVMRLLVRKFGFDVAVDLNVLAPQVGLDALLFRHRPFADNDALAHHELLMHDQPLLEQGD